MASLPPGFDPTLQCAGNGRLFGEQLYSTLTALDDANTPRPSLAESLELSADRRTYTVRLRDGVRFHDGREVTAEDVAYTFTRQADPATAYHHGHWSEPIVSAEAIDQRTARIRLSRPVDAFPTWLAFHGSAIVPADRAARGELTATPVGSGPYTLAAAGPDRVRLDRRPDLAADEPPWIDALEFVVLPDAEAVDALVAGGVDLVPAMPPEDWARVGVEPGLARQSRLDGRWHWISLNTTRPPFDDVRVRQAVAWAVDRNAIVEDCFLGHAEPILGLPVPPWSWGARPGLDRFARGPDLGRARVLVAAACVRPGTPVRLRLAGWIPLLVAEGEAVARALEALGFAVEVESLPQAAYMAEVWRGDHDFDATTMHWGSTMVDPDDFLAYGYRCGMKNNVEGWCSPAFDAALERALAAPGPAARAPLYDEPGGIVLDELPRVPLVFGELLAGFSDRLRGFRLRPNGSLLGLRDSWLAE